ncbi:MAG: sortase [Propionibacteriaceae bacterium]|jgi:sortase A|nr:sortase [Propionibacteriaceae bacterium]
MARTTTEGKRSSGSRFEDDDDAYAVPSRPSAPTAGPVSPHVGHSAVPEPSRAASDWLSGALATTPAQTPAADTFRTSAVGATKLSTPVTPGRIAGGQPPTRAARPGQPATPPSARADRPAAARAGQPASTTPRTVPPAGTAEPTNPSAAPAARTTGGQPAARSAELTAGRTAAAQPFDRAARPATDQPATTARTGRGAPTSSSPVIAPSGAAPSLKSAPSGTRSKDSRDKAPTRADTTQPKRKSKAASIFLGFGVAFLAAGLGMMGWVSWELWGTNIGVRDQYDEQIGQLEQIWSEPDQNSGEVPTDPTGEEPAADDGTRPLIQYNLGSGFAILDIPKLGLRAPIIAGTDESSLSHGVGWETYSAQPGQVGNFVIAGHHSSRGHPFDALQSLVEGDEFTVETKDMIYTYRMLNSPNDLTVEFTETWVTLPDPYKRTTDATRKLATLLTCREFFSTPYRSIGFAELVAEQPRPA